MPCSTPAIPSRPRCSNAPSVRWWGCQTFGARPDLITFAKGVTSGYVPLGGVLVGDRVARALIEQGGEFNHGYTYSGHPVACAVAVANIRLIQRERLVEKVRDDLRYSPKQKLRWSRR